MAAVKWKEPLFIWIPVGFFVLTLISSNVHSQWVTYRRSGRHSSNLWHPNMPVPRTLRHSTRSSLGGPVHPSPSSASSPSEGRHRQLEHRSVSHSNYFTIPDKGSTGLGYQGARYSSADYSKSTNPTGSGRVVPGKSVRISDIPARSSSSSPTQSNYQRSLQSQQHQTQSQVPSSVMSHRHIQNNVQPSKNKVNWQLGGKNSGNQRPVQDSTRRPVSQQAGHLLDSWPNSNTHHHLAPVGNSQGTKPSYGANQQAHQQSHHPSQHSQPGKSGYTNLKTEQWGNNVLVSNKPIELKSSKPSKPKYNTNDKHASDRQLILPSGYPVKDKTAVTNTINTLTKLSPKKPIFVFMRKEGILAVKSGADAGDVIKKLAGTSKLPFYNGTVALPSHNVPTVFLAPEDMTAPSGYGKIPIPNLKPNKNTTPKPTYTKILMPGGTHMKGSLVTTSTTTTSTPPTPTFGAPVASPSSLSVANSSALNNLSFEQKLQILQLLRTQPNHPLADQLAMGILSSSAASPSPASSVNIPAVVPSPGSVHHGPPLLTPTQPPSPASGGAPQWPNLFQGVLPAGSVIESINGQSRGIGQGPGVPPQIGSSTISPLMSTISPSPSSQPGGEGDIHKLIGTIVESAVSNTVSSMLHHQRLLQNPGQQQQHQQQQQQHQQQQPQLVGVGPPLHAPQGPPGSRPPSGPPPPGFHHPFGRGPPPHPPGLPPRPQGPPPPQLPPRFGYQQRPPFPPSPAPGGRFPPYPSAAPPNPSVGPPSPTGAPPPQGPIAQASQRPYQIAPAPQQFPQGPYQHPFVPQFQPSGPPTQSTPRVDFPSEPTTPFPPTQQPFGFNPSSTPGPYSYPPHGRPPHGKQPPLRMVERPFTGKGRNPLHNALNFFGISTPRPDPSKPSPTPPFMSSTPYPHPPHPSASPSPFRPGPPQQFPGSTPGPMRFPPSPYPPQQQFPGGPPPQQNQQFPGAVPQQSQQFQQTIQHNQVQMGLDENKKPTLVVQTPVQGPNGPTGKKNTYVITGGGNELPELNKIMKVLNELHIDSENTPSQQTSQQQGGQVHQFPSSTPSSVSMQPQVVSPSLTPNMFPSPRPFGVGPTHVPNVMIKNSNVGITPSPMPHMSSTGQPVSPFISSTPNYNGVSPSVSPQFVSSTPSSISNVSPVMQIINSIQQQIPGFQVSPSLETLAENHHLQNIVQQQQTVQQQQQQPQQQQQQPQQIFQQVSSPRPPPAPTPGPGQVIISSTGFPRVMNINPGSATPASIHQAVVEAIMKQQNSGAIGSTPRPFIINVSPTPGPIRSSSPQYIEVIPAGGQIPGLGGDTNNKPFIVHIPQQQQQQPSPSPIASPEHPSDDHPIKLDDPNIIIQKGSLESHETYAEKRKPSGETGERRPVYSKERHGSKTHHHSKEVSDEYPDKTYRRPGYSREDYEHEEQINPNRRMYSGEKEQSKEEKLIEKVITEEKIVWKQGPGVGEMIPAKVRTEERIIIRPSGSRSKETDTRVDDEFTPKRTPLSSAEHFVNLAKTPSASLEASLDKTSAGLISKEVGNSESPSNFAGILRSKLKFDRLMEKLYPTKQLVSPFTITNNSANFYKPNSAEVVAPASPTIASSLVTTAQQHFASVSPTLSSFLNSISSTPLTDPGRFKIRPGEVSHDLLSPVPTGAQNMVVGVSPSGQPILMQGSPSTPLQEQTIVTSSQQPSSSVPTGSSIAPGSVEQRLIFIPQGTASAPVNSNNPKILITTVDELPDLMAQLSGTNSEIRMVPDKATLEAELAKVAESSTVEAKTTSASTTTTTTSTTSSHPPTTAPVPTKASVQSTLFRMSPTPDLSSIRRMDGPEQAFTWRPANATMSSPLSTTLSWANERKLVSGLGAGMLHAMSAGFGNVGNAAYNKFPWLGPSVMPPQQGPTQMLYTMQNGVPVPISVNHPKLPIAGPYQQVLINDPKENGGSLGYYGYKWGDLVPRQEAQPSPPSPSPTTTKTPEYKLKYRSQYRDDELPPAEDKVVPVSPVHKLKKASKNRVKTTKSPIDPVSQEDYEDDDDDEDLIPHESLVPKHRKHSQEESEEESPNRRRFDSRRNKPGRRRRPGKLQDDDDDDDSQEETRHKTNKGKPRPTKPTHGKVRSDEDASDDDDYDVYDVKPAHHFKRKGQKVEPSPSPTSLPTTTTTTANKNKAIYVNREMFMVSGEEKGKDNNPKAEPVYQPSQGSMTNLKLPVIQVPSIISGQSVVKKTGSTMDAVEASKPTTLEPKTTASSPPSSPSTTATTSTTTQKLTTAALKKILSTKATPTTASKGKKKKNEDDVDYKDTQDELRSLLKKIQDRLGGQDEVYDFGEDGGLYDYYDEIQQVLSTKATTTTKATTLKGKKSKGKKNGKKGKKSKKNKNKKKSEKAPKTTQKPKKAVTVTQSIPTRKPVTTPTTEAPKVHHHQRHPVSSLETFTSNEEASTTAKTTTTTTTTAATTTTTRAPPLPPQPYSDEVGSVEGAPKGSGSVESTPSSVQYVFSETAKEDQQKLKRRPLWIRRRIAGSGLGSQEALQSMRRPNGPNGKVIRLVRRRRPQGPGKRRMMQHQQQTAQSFEEPEQTTTTQQPTPSSPASIEVAPPNYSSPPLEQYFEQNANSLERRVGTPDSMERSNGTVTLRSPKRKLKLIRLKGQRAQWRLRLQGAGDDSSELSGPPRPAALIQDPRNVSPPLPLQAPLPAPVYTTEGLHSSSNSNARAAKSSDVVATYATSFTNSESNSVEAKVCVRGKCEVVSKH